MKFSLQILKWGVLFFGFILLSSCGAWDTLKEMPSVMDWWEWIVFALLIIFIIILILAASGVESAMAILTAIIKAIVAAMGYLIRGLLWLLRFLYEKILTPIGRWLLPKLKPLWDDIKGNVKWDVIKWIIAFFGINSIRDLINLFYKGGKIKLPCPSTTTLPPFQFTLDGEGSSWCFFKSSLASAVKAAEQEAENNAIKNMNDALNLTAGLCECSGSCSINVSTPNSSLVPNTTKHIILPGKIIYSIKAKSTATGTITISCK